MPFKKRGFDCFNSTVSNKEIIFVTLVDTNLFLLQVTSIILMPWFFILVQREDI